MYKEERREKQGREGGISFLHLTCFPDEFFNDQIQSTVKTSQGERNPQRMNQKRNDLGNVFLFRGKKTGFNFALPLLLFTNYEDFPATAWRGSDTEPGTGTGRRGLCQTRFPWGAARLHHIQRLSAPSPPHINNHPGLYREETGLDVCFNKPAAKFSVIFLYIFAVLCSAHVFGESCSVSGLSGFLWQ